MVIKDSINIIYGQENKIISGINKEESDYIRKSEQKGNSEKEDQSIKKTFDSTFSLYFDNAMPDNTGKTYFYYLADYLLKKDQYIEEANKYKYGPATEINKKELESFFDNKLLQSGKQLDSLFGFFLKEVKNNKKLNISIKVNTSRLASLETNIKIAERRYLCFMKTIEEWNNGVLANYFGKNIFLKKEEFTVENTNNLSIGNREIHERIYSLSSTLMRSVELKLELLE